MVPWDDPRCGLLLEPTLREVFDLSDDRSVVLESRDELSVPIVDDSGGWRRHQPES
jgi:hypothetical protein